MISHVQIVHLVSKLNKLTVEVMVENTSMRYGTKIAQHKVQLPFHSFYYFYVAHFSCLRQHFIVND